MTNEEVTDYTSISYIKLCFAEDTFLHAQFEQDYSRDIVDEIDELFTTTARTKVHTKCLERLTALITSTILDDEDTQGDPTHIKTLLDKSLRLRAKLKNQYRGRIRTWKDLKNILNRAVLIQTTVIEIFIGFKGLQQDPKFKHNFLHWDHYSLIPYDEDSHCEAKPNVTKTPATTSPSFTDIAAEFATVVSSTQATAAALPSASDIATENAAAVTTNSTKMFNIFMQSYPPASAHTPSSSDFTKLSGVPPKSHCTPMIETLADDHPGTLWTRTFCTPDLETLADDDQVAYYDPTSPSTPMVETLADDDPATLRTRAFFAPSLDTLADHDPFIYFLIPPAQTLL